MKGNIMERRVVSWPPCILEVLVKKPAGLPMRVPFSHKGAKFHLMRAT
jgi:hypothetical protein